MTLEPGDLILTGFSQQYFFFFKIQIFKLFFSKKKVLLLALVQ